MQSDVNEAVQLLCQNGGANLGVADKGDVLFFFAGEVFPEELHHYIHLLVLPTKKTSDAFAEKKTLLLFEWCLQTVVSHVQLGGFCCAAAAAGPGLLRDGGAWFFARFCLRFEGCLEIGLKDELKKKKPLRVNVAGIKKGMKTTDHDSRCRCT